MNARPEYCNAPYFTVDEIKYVRYGGMFCGEFPVDCATCNYNKSLTPEQLAENRKSAHLLYEQNLQDLKKEQS